jgi:CHAT domain-containing protein
MAVGGAAQADLRHSLAAGVYLVEVREHDVDLRLVVDAGNKRAEIEDQVPRHGRLYRIVSLDQPGELRMEIRGSDHRTKQGRASVLIARWKRAVGAPPSKLELGYAAFSAAQELTAAGNPESWTRSADKMHEALTHFEEAGDEGAHAEAAYFLANLQYSRDEWAATIAATEIAGDAYRSAGDDAGVQNASALRAAAELELAAGMSTATQRAAQSATYQAADRRLAAAAEFFKAHGMPVRAQYAINMRGVRAVVLGDYDNADKFLSEALAMARANQDIAEQTKSLANLAYLHYRRGFVSRAAEEYEALLPIVDRENQKYVYGVVLGNYGFCLIALGDFDRALALHTEALELFTKVGDQDERATELAALGGLYFRMGDAQRALQTLRAAMVAQEQVGDTRGLASTLRVAGNASSVLGERAAALAYLRKSAQIDANPHSVARTSVLIAAELRRAGDLIGAEAELRAPLASTNAMVRASALEERAHLRLAQRDHDAAIADLRAADRQFADLGLEFNRIDTNTALSALLLARKDTAGAAATADEAVSIVSRIRTKSANPEWRARFLAARYSPFEARIAVDLAAGDASPELAAWRAFRTAERVRARSLSDEISAGGSAARRDSDPEEKALRASLTSLQLRLENRMQRQDADEAGTLELRRDIEETRARLEKIRLERRGVAAGEATLPDDIREIQNALPPDTAVLAYFVGDERSHAWLLDRRGVRHAPLAGRESLQRAIDAMFGEQRQRQARNDAARRLGKMLLVDLLDGVPEKRLLIITDGPLSGVPFAALPASQGSTETLIDRFVLGYAPSLALAMQAGDSGGKQPARVAVISDPVYAFDDRRLRTASISGNNLRGTTLPVPDNLSRLPYSALEAGTVLKEFGAEQTVALSGFDATPERVIELRSTHLAILHFATHAAARRDSPEQSALFLSRYTPDGNPIPDNQLSVADIARSGLRADLVVLSGCSTGDGNELRGEGVLGLTYGFLANGSRSVVAALWPIEDASTARFMGAFYGAYRKSGNAAEALRAAQLQMRGKTPASVWSSFVVRANGFP